MVEPDQHVLKRDDRWVVQGRDDARPSSSHDTVREAIEAARRIARQRRARVVIHAPGENVEGVTPPAASRDRRRAEAV